MDYYDQNNYQNSNNEQLLFETESESEFDEFEHHLSQYENKCDEELFNEDESLMFHDGDRSEEEDDSSHQISLATSFCKNTQEQNEDFLEDKFSGDLLLEQFSEDKFIKCKYSEDFYCEQQLIEANKQLSESEDDHCENKQLIEERSSEDELMIEKRKQHFIEFISTIPKVCTPSVCGTMTQRSDYSVNNYRTENRNHPLDRLTEANEDSIFENDIDNIITSTQKANSTDHDLQQANFDWSIDQLATLKPVDISFNERRFLRFKSFESDQLTQEKLIKENDLFFSQETIAPSPIKNRVFKNVGLNDSKLIYGSKIFNNERTSSSNVTDQIFDDNRMSSANNVPNDKIINGIYKDSGNYSEDDQETIINLNKKFDDQFEFSFIEHSDNRLSKIEFDSEIEHTQISPLEKNNKSFVRPSNKATLKLDFEPNSILQQTSTPCTSMFKLKEFKTNFNQFNQNIVQNDSEERTKNQQNNSDRLPLQQRSSIKQKKRLFHNLTDSSNFYASSTSSSTSASNDTNNSTNSSQSITKDEDEGIDQSSKEVTFGSNDSFLMSVCDNNSLTPRPKKSRSSVLKSFAERLNEIELLNDENRSNSINTNLTTDSQNSRWHNLTDSNCFMIKNFNNFNFNNSDSGCYFSNASNGSSGVEIKK